MKHRIGLTVTDPNHPMVSKRKETIQKTVRVSGEDREKAINSAIAHYKRKGYKVHDHHYIGTVNEDVEQIDELSRKTLSSYVNKARSDRMDALHSNYRNTDDDYEAAKKDNERVEKRDRGINLARAKINKFGKSGNTIAKVKATEEVEQIDEVGDTAKGQKLLQRVNKRAVDRLTSKRADTDPAYAKKAQQTHLAADERLKEESDVYAKSEENKRSADAAKKQGDMMAHHLHMADYHDNLAQWNAEKGRHSVADNHAEKSEQHHAQAMKLKEEVEQVDELRTSTLLRYQTKANKALIGGDRNKEEKRIKSIQKANYKIQTRHRVKEDVEIEEGRKLYKMEGSLEKWTKDAEAAGHTVLHHKGKTDPNSTHHAINKDGKVVGKFFNATYVNNKRGHLQTESVEIDEAWTQGNRNPQRGVRVGDKVRSYDFPGMHDDHYIEGHVVADNPHSYHIRVNRVVRGGKEIPTPAHMTHVEAPKGRGMFSNAYAVHKIIAKQNEVSAAPEPAKGGARTFANLRGKK